MILARNYMCSLMMISDMLSKHVRAVKSVLKKWFKINDIQLVHLLVVWYLVNLQDARCNNEDKYSYVSMQPLHAMCGRVQTSWNIISFRTGTCNLHCILIQLTVTCNSTAHTGSIVVSTAKWLRGLATVSWDTYTAEPVVFLFRRKKPDYIETSLFGT